MRSLRIIVATGVLAPLVLAATACGPNNDDKSSTTATTAPIGTATAAPTGAGTGAAAKALTQDQLVKALLTVKDLQADQNRSSLGATKSQHKLTANKAACQPLLDLADAGNAATPPAASATGAYFGTNGREYTVIQLTQFGAGQAAKAMTSGEAALGSCAAFNATSQGQPAMKVTFSKATFQAAGDATLALNAKFTADDCANAPCEARSYVIVRSGDVLTMLSNSALADPGMPEQDTVKKQLDKLHAAAK
ncbi:hypothetical protein F7Q99_01680 [Streptomyces kaniharaensis]|uniref:Sensor domain-containing protein n=1 Tax=Streptomyces kaniharaensis TaxID=212423 RepID=A0A6N7KLE4_9ACTN|nr:hypothetical protein [Streptomyces kaniharaensis]MQS11024.1 hypothetical protein [Streptomyces kaniharaensis]